MKIIHVLNFFPPEQIAGTEIYTLILAKEQLKMGHDVSVLIPNFDTNINFTYQHEGIKVYKYAEPTKADRLVLLGKKKTAGLANFHQY